jgi:O-antigen/teichoic acid export membrane protein
MAEINLGKNILWILSSRFGAQVILAVSNLLLARYLGSSGFGEYAFISAIVFVGNAFSTFGTDMILIRRISASNDYSDVPAALVIQLLFSLLCIAAIFAASPVLPVAHPLRIYILALIPLSLFTVSTTALRGAQYMGSFSVLHFLVACLQLFSVFVLIALDGRIEQLAILFLCAQVLGAILGFVFCLSKIKGFSVFSPFGWNRIPRLVIASAQVALIGALRLIYEKLAVLFLPLLTGIHTTGLFSASLRVLDAAKLGHMSALTAMYPEMAREKSFPKSIEKGYGLLLLTSFLFSVLLYLLAEPVIRLLFGEEFSSSAISLKILAWVIIPYFIVSYYSLAFVAVEIERPVLVSLTVSLAILVSLLYWWSPLYGLQGAAFAVLCAESIQAILLLFQWRQHAFSKRSG